MHQLASLPKKLGVWARFIDTEILPGTEPPQIQAVLSRLQSFSYRMQELLAEEDRGTQVPLLLQELQSDIKTWRARAEETLQRLAGDYDAGEKEILQIKLAALVDHLEQRIVNALDSADDNQVTDLNENFYRLLGAYRGVSEALVECAGSAHTINWSRWQEEKF